MFHLTVKWNCCNQNSRQPYCNLLSYIFICCVDWLKLLSPVAPQKDNLVRELGLVYVDKLHGCEKTAPKINVAMLTKLPV